jgi:hypothetical protein
MFNQIPVALKAAAVNNALQLGRVTTVACIDK